MLFNFIHINLYFDNSNSNKRNDKSDDSSDKKRKIDETNKDESGNLKYFSY